MSESQSADAVSADEGERLLARAESRLGERDFTGAFDDFTAAEAHLGPDDPRVTFGLSMTRLALQEEERARVQEARLRSHPHDIEAALRLADARRRVGKVKEAVEALEAAARMAPQDPRVHHELGLTLLCWVKDHDASLPHFDRALSLKPDMVPALTFRANARREAGRPDLAIDDYSRLQDLTPGDVGLHESRAFAYLDLGDFARAESDFDRVLGHRPEAHFYYTQRGACRLALDRPEEAIADFTEALRLRQEEAMRWYDQEEDDEEPHDPDADALKGRGQAWFLLGELASARADLVAAAAAYRDIGKEDDARTVEALLAEFPPIG